MIKENIFERIKRMPRMNYIKEPTPLYKLEHLSKALGCEVEIYIKRDDLLPFGGNKVRKLEFLFAEALKYGADTVITGSTVQCNHNLMALLIANMEGMKTELILENFAKPDYKYASDPNRQLFEFGGVRKIDISSEPITGQISSMELALNRKDELTELGEKPYILERGGTCPLGNCGYVICADEIISQASDMEIDFDYLICPSGTGGTQMGLLIGFDAANYPITVLGISVAFENEKHLVGLSRILDQTEAFLDVQVPIEKVHSVDGYLGKGYAKPTPEVKEAIELTARTQGVMLDPVYSGKTMAGLIGMIRKGEIKKGSKVIFLHTGGFNTYYDYSSMSELVGETNII